MGKKLSKTSLRSNKIESDAQSVQQEEQYEIYDPEKYHLEAVEILKREFKEDPEMFVVNMLLMSFMFFDDYQKEIRTLVNTSSERGKELNLELIRNHQKQVLMPDSVLESVNNRVKFVSSDEPDKDVVQPLMPQRMFILHDTIEIEDKNFSADYSRIDKPSYRAVVEESKEHRGFVKIRKVESEIRTPSTDSASSSTSSKPSKAKSDSSKNGCEEYQESDYGYRTITAARTPEQLHISEKDIYTKINKLPSKCITPIKVKNMKDLSDSESDEEHDSHKEKKHKRNTHEIELFRIQNYFNSFEFMAHFNSNIFPNTLGEALSFSNELIHQAKSIPGAIYCDTVDDTQNIIQWEIIPSIPMPWPDELAFEWTLRRRRTVWDKKEKNPVAYKWPTEKMVEEVNKLNCVVIPRGFMPKKGKNPEMHLEWEVGFPKAERYLEFRMSHAQMRVFLYLIILHKYYIEPKTKKHGLVIDHIRMLMFWECETNYKAWPEHKLGTKLRLVLKVLVDYLGKAQMPNYFIRGKNVLINIPRKYLLEAQNALFCIYETPLPYLLEALKCVRYTQGKFYPEPDLQRLYEILTNETFLPKQAQVTILAQVKVKQEGIKQDKEQKWNNRYMEQQRIANAKKKLLRNVNAENSKNLHLQKIKSNGSIDLNFAVKKHLNNDVACQISLLTFFIQHFLQIAKKSIKISSTNQTLFYLKQSFYLTKLLEGIEIEKENAKHFQMQIKEEEENCLRKQITEPKVPLTPKRNSSFFANEILHVKGKEINIANLRNSYNSTTAGAHSSTNKIEFQQNHVSNINKSESYVEETKIENDNKNKRDKNVKRVVLFKSADLDNVDIDHTNKESTSL